MTKPVCGIDLGTTHCVLATASVDDPVPCVFDVPQLVTKTTLEARALLPSFLYVAHASDGRIALPWDQERTFSVGEHARSQAALTPARVVSSAKSWLCHPTMDRRAASLPEGAPTDVDKISPVEASWRYLEHLAEAFAHVSKRSLVDHDVILTVPASFDASARDLTVEAAFAAGLEGITLLEEPQAALYAWMGARGDAWRNELHVGDVVLVIDVGGGTTDFSAIRVTDENGALGLVRVAVGDHILVGGDNMDLALAHTCAEKLRTQGKDIDAWQSVALRHAARVAKERLLSSDDASAIVSLASRGSALVGGTLRTELKREDIVRVIEDGFFPLVPLEAKPGTRTRTALSQVGLPYAQDAGITRHVSHFLTRQAIAPAKMLRPTAILFNGGVLKSAALRARLLERINAWLASDGAPPARELSGADYDFGVAKGAAAFGLVRAGKGIRIRGGTARAYYVGVESAAPAVPGMAPPITALCVAPFGMEEGASVDLPHELGLVVGEKVSFRFFGSSVRRDDRAGTVLDRLKDLEELPQIQIEAESKTRTAGDVVPVRLSARITEIGTLSLAAIASTDERWVVELSIRGA